MTNVLLLIGQLTVWWMTRKLTPAEKCVFHALCLRRFANGYVNPYFAIDHLRADVEKAKRIIAEGRAGDYPIASSLRRFAEQMEAKRNALG